MKKTTNNPEPYIIQVSPKHMDSFIRETPDVRYTPKRKKLKGWQKKKR